MGQQQSLIYSLVARGDVILAEYTEFKGNFTGIAAKCLRKLPASNKRLTYICDGHTFNFLIHDGFTYCVVAVKSAGQEIPNAFLEHIKDEFTKRDYSFNKAFGSKLKEQMEYRADHPKEISKLPDHPKEISKLPDHPKEIRKLPNHPKEISKLPNHPKEISKLPNHPKEISKLPNHPKEISKLANIKPAVFDGKGVIMENIDMILDCAEKIKLLVDKNEKLHSQGNPWRVTPTQKKQLILASSIVLISYYIMICRAICGKFFCDPR